MKINNFRKLYLDHQSVDALYDLGCHLYENRKDLPEDFDYPDYAGYKGADYLLSEQVDLVQDRWDEILKCRTLKQFLRMMLP